MTALNIFLKLGVAAHAHKLVSALGALDDQLGMRVPSCNGAGGGSCGGGGGYPTAGYTAPRGPPTTTTRTRLLPQQRCGRSR